MYLVWSNDGGETVETISGTEAEIAERIERDGSHTRRGTGDTEAEARAAYEADCAAWNAAHADD